MNSEANVIKIDNATTAKEKLTIRERNALSKAVTGHGRMKRAVQLSGVSKDTIAKAKSGMEILTDTANKLRTFLNL